MSFHQHPTLASVEFGEMQAAEAPSSLPTNPPNMGQRAAGREAHRSVHACEFCGFQSKKKKDFQAHQARHVKKSLYQCELCTFSIGTFGHLNYHRNHHHASTSVGNSNTHPKVFFVCIYFAKNVFKYFCFYFVAISQVQLPVSRKVYRCSHCGFQTNFLYSLKRHVEKHQTKSKHQCQLCSYSSASLAGLGHHQSRDHRNRLQNNEVDHIEVNQTILTFHFSSFAKSPNYSTVF